jgi:endonuclease/exonuclease/phosphatase family metal-dependent hydrolase
VAGTGARRYWWIWAAAIPILLWALVRSFGLERGFPLVPMLAYTPYVAVIALLVSGVAVALRNWAAVAVAGLATLCLMTAVLPRAFGSAETIPPGAAKLDVLSTNIHYGGADPAALIALVDRRDPDILFVQELTPSFARKLDEAGVRRRLPHSVLSLRSRAAGAGIYSRLPLQRLPEAARFGFRMPRAEVRLPDGRPVRIVDVHPYTPKRPLIDRWREGLESLPSTGAGAPWLLVGDFNATLDHAELRDVIDRGYRDAADVTGDGLTPTWPTGSVLLPPVTIDHILADKRFLIGGYGVEGLPGSDHQAIFARLALAPEP